MRSCDRHNVQDRTLKHLATKTRRSDVQASIHNTYHHEISLVFQTFAVPKMARKQFCLIFICALETQLEAISRKTFICLKAVKINWS